MNDEQRFKVLVAGRSCHGGDLAWSLPTPNDDGTWTPGDWHTVAGDLRLCKVGLHLTTEPARWLLVGCEAYRAEGERPGRRDGDKQVFGRVRLLAPAPEAIPVWWRRVETFVRDDLPRWEAALGGRPDVTIRVYPDADHFFVSGSGPSRPLSPWT